METGAFIIIEIAGDLKAVDLKLDKKWNRKSQFTLTNEMINDIGNPMAK